jgi:hypothetical protein
MPEQTAMINSEPTKSWGLIQPGSRSGRKTGKTRNYTAVPRPRTVDRMLKRAHGNVKAILNFIIINIISDINKPGKQDISRKR